VADDDTAAMLRDDHNQRTAAVRAVGKRVASINRMNL
jgi:hypothetical protein